jgi:hypothetical protein
VLSGAHHSVHCCLQRDDAIMDVRAEHEKHAPPTVFATPLPTVLDISSLIAACSSNPLVFTVRRPVTRGGWSASALMYAVEEPRAVARPAARPAGRPAVPAAASAADVIDLVGSDDEVEFVPRAPSFDAPGAARVEPTAFPAVNGHGGGTAAAAGGDDDYDEADLDAPPSTADAAVVVAAVKAEPGVAAVKAEPGVAAVKAEPGMALATVPAQPAVSGPQGDDDDDYEETDLGATAGPIATSASGVVSGAQLVGAASDQGLAPAAGGGTGGSGGGPVDDGDEYEETDCAELGAADTSVCAGDLSSARVSGENGVQAQVEEAEQVEGMALYVSELFGSSGGGASEPPADDGMSGFYYENPYDMYNAAEAVYESDGEGDGYFCNDIEAMDEAPFAMDDEPDVKAEGGAGEGGGRECVGGSSGADAAASGVGGGSGAGGASTSLPAAPAVTVEDDGVELITKDEALKGDGMWTHGLAWAVPVLKDYKPGEIPLHLHPARHHSPRVTSPPLWAAVQVWRRAAQR